MTIEVAAQLLTQNVVAIISGGSYGCNEEVEKLILQALREQDKITRQACADKIKVLSHWKNDLGEDIHINTRELVISTIMNVKD